MAKTADVIIEVEGGVATCTKLRDGLVLKIIDRDAERSGNLSEDWYGAGDDEARRKEPHLPHCKHCGGEVQYSGVNNNFYCIICKQGQGVKYYNEYRPCFQGGTWHNRDKHGKCTDCEN